MSDKIVGVGTGVFVFKDGKFIMMKRQGAHGAGTWSVPGGKMDYGETFAQTAQREVKEETGVDIKNVRFAGVTNNRFVSEGKHDITIWLTAEWKTGKPQIMEPNKCSELEWKTFDELPDNLFLPWEELLKSQFIDGIKALI